MRGRYIVVRMLIMLHLLYAYVESAAAATAAAATAANAAIRAFAALVLVRWQQGYVFLGVFKFFCSHET